MCDIDPALVSALGDRPHPIVERMVRLAGARPHQPASVTGPAALAGLIALCRMGFERVECARDATCGGADGASEVLFVCGPCTGGDLAQTVSRTARLLADGGVLVAHEWSLDDDIPLEARLAELGLVVEWKLHDLADATLVAVRVHRERPALRRAA